MSRDLVLQPCRYDGTTELVENPWTHEIHEVLRNAPLSAGEVRAVREVLARAWVRGPHARDVYVLDLPRRLDHLRRGHQPRHRR